MPRRQNEEYGVPPRKKELRLAHGAVGSHWRAIHAVLWSFRPVRTANSAVLLRGNPSSSFCLCGENRLLAADRKSTVGHDFGNNSRQRRLRPTDVCVRQDTSCPPVSACAGISGLGMPNHDEIKGLTVDALIVLRRLKSKRVAKVFVGRCPFSAPYRHLRH